MAPRGSLLLLALLVLSCALPRAPAQHWSHGWYPGGKRDLRTPPNLQIIHPGISPPELTTPGGPGPSRALPPSPVSPPSGGSAAGVPVPWGGVRVLGEWSLCSPGVAVSSQDPCPTGVSVSRGVGVYPAEVSLSLRGLMWGPGGFGGAGSGTGAEFRAEVLQKKREERLGGENSAELLEEHRRLMAWNDEENARQRARREERLRKEAEEEKRRKLEVAEKQARKMEAFMKEKEQEVLQLQEEAKSFITLENLDARIEECLDNPRNYNFAIDKDGRVVKRTVLS
ncbi:PREDICTED: uncharacterized protein LOC108504256 [Lepidothrix coronata]|uniref:Small ribosomal subunit protein mS26 n=1 Tax=Lepidothrix coronata TaxID=321398 RepID=A0A6J0ICX2_9PASS|nr:PREDICTED: uncharacterized protein LOC108504256 [Lepidothrix coronata]